LKSVLIIAIIAASLINLSYGYIEGFIPFLFMRLCWGITWSFLRLGGYLSVISYSDEYNRGRLMGIYQSISGVGFISGGLVGGILLDSWGFTSAITFLVLGTFLVIPIAFSIVDKKLVSIDQDHSFDIRTLVGNTEVLSIGIGVMLTRLFLGSLISSTLSLYLAEVFGSEGITLLGMEVGIASLTGFLLSFRLYSKFLLGPIVGVLSDKLGGQRTMMILFISGSFSLLLLALNQSLGIITLAVILSFISDAGLGVVLTSQVGDIVQTNGAKGQYTLSAFTNWIDLGSALGPLIIFSLLSEISFNLIFKSASAFLLLYALFVRRVIK